MFRYIILAALPMFASAQKNPPQILQVYRDFLKPGSAAAYRNIEEEAARICAKLKCPHPYLGLESLTGPKEVWFLNGYASLAEQQQVAWDYSKNSRLTAALNQIVTRKHDLTLEPANVSAKYRADLSSETPWSRDTGVSWSSR